MNVQWQVTHGTQRAGISLPGSRVSPLHAACMPRQSADHRPTWSACRP